MVFLFKIVQLTVVPLLIHALYAELGRKLTLISALPAVVSQEAISYLWASFLFSFAAVILTGHLKPYSPRARVYV